MLRGFTKVSGDQLRCTAHELSVRRAHDHEHSVEKSYVPLINVTGMSGMPSELAQVVSTKVATHRSMLRSKVTSEASPLML